MNKSYLNKNYKLYFNEDKLLKFFFKSRNITIVDVGANKGQSIMRYKKIFPESKIFSFEPDPKIFKELNMNVKKYRNINLYNFALGDKNSIKKFYFNKNSSDTSSIVPFNSKSFSIKSNFHPKIKYKPKDIIIKNIVVKKGDFVLRKLKKIHFLKTETQGFEYNVLKGFKNSFKNIIMIKLSVILDDVYNLDVNKNHIKILDLLKNDFVIYDICHIYKNFNSYRTLWFEYIFVNKNIKL